MHWFHTWTPWERYLWTGKVGVRIVRVTGVTDSEMRDITEDRQKRHCSVCGYHQDQLVRSF